MLAVKAVMASHSQLPTIIFDEIDSGISGEIALKMATIMKKMSETMQVIAITHLPQIVASGKEHMKVYKYADKQQTKTNIKLLNKEERVLEIAEMLGGKNITETAINHAKQLLE
jgi:DNA repair protein RecN (Recombination protein N)